MTKVVFFPSENKKKITYIVLGAIRCSRNNRFLITFRTLATADGIWQNIFTGDEELKQFLEAQNDVTKDVALVDLGYDSCDYVC